MAEERSGPYYSTSEPEFLVIAHSSQLSPTPPWGKNQQTTLGNFSKYTSSGVRPSNESWGRIEL